MLGPTYRFRLLNSTGQSLAQNSVTLKTIREKFTSAGALSLEGSEASLAFATLAAGVLTTGSYDATATQDNTTNLYLGGTFVWTVTAPASSNGNVTVWLQHSTDGGTTWPDDGEGIQMPLLNFTTSGTKRKEFRL